MSKILKGDTSMSIYDENTWNIFSKNMANIFDVEYTPTPPPEFNIKQSFIVPPWNKGLKGVQVPWNLGIPHSDETKKKIGLIHKGKTISQGIREKTSKTLKGVKKRPEQGQKISSHKKGKLQPFHFIEMECPHCGKHSNPGNYKQFHGDNCKHKLS